jgi:hypothetical protein
MRRLALAVLLLFPVAGRGDTPRPAFVVQPDGVVAATLPLAVLEEPAVHRQLGSGLTTTFLLIVRERETRRVTAARLEVRYDLWDEVWIVRRIELDRRGAPQRLPSRDALEKWWRSPVRVLSTSAARVALQVELNVLPFSAAEEEDARQWMAKAGGVGTAGAGNAGLVDVLIGTTISAKPITSYRWNVDLSVR